MAEHWEIVNRGQVVAFDTPQELWENATSYFFWCDNNPIESKRTVMAGSKTGTQVGVKQTRPYSLKALCLHCGILEDYIKSVWDSKKKESEYYIVVSRILYIIYTQNLEQALVGEFNPILASKILNMDKEEAPTSSIKVEIVQGLPALANSENEILEKLDSENKLFENT